MGVRCSSPSFQEHFLCSLSHDLHLLSWIRIYTPLALGSGLLSGVWRQAYFPSLFPLASPCKRLRLDASVSRACHVEGLKTPFQMAWTSGALVHAEQMGVSQTGRTPVTLAMVSFGFPLKPLPTPKRDAHFQSSPSQLRGEGCTRPPSPVNPVLRGNQKDTTRLRVPDFFGADLNGLGNRMEIAARFAVASNEKQKAAQEELEKEAHSVCLGPLPIRGFLLVSFELQKGSRPHIFGLHAKRAVGCGQTETCVTVKLPGW